MNWLQNEVETGHHLRYNEQIKMVQYVQPADAAMILKTNDGRCNVLSGMNRQKNRTCKRIRSAHKGVMRTIAGIAVLGAVFALTFPVAATDNASVASATAAGEKLLHTHNVFCFDSTGRFICPLRQLEEHEHSEDCYETVAQGHTHTDECYTMERGALICQVAEQSGHIHTDACYKTENETEAAHEHTAACYTKTKGEQICTVPEREGHSHGKGCFVSGETLICTLEENEEHTHAASCYEKILQCEIPEEAGHTHSDACFAWTEILSCTADVTAPEKILICTETEQEGHAHNDACYEWTKVLSCGKEEQNTESSAPTETEQVLICTQVEIKKHTHGKICFALDRHGKKVLICKQPQVKEHQHTQACLSFAEADLICKEESREHRHDYRCYRTWSFQCQTQENKKKLPQSDPNADVETPEIWEKTFEHVKLTGAWSQDLLAIAQTQLGYAESGRNFIIENGIAKGYTRYGEWYGGVEYGNWCAMFIAFCMDYAGIKGVPFSCGCNLWLDLLKEAGMYAAPDAYTPRPGDIVFFDTSRALNVPETVPVVPDHVGIVVEVIPETEDEPAAVVTIEGNYYDCVRNETRYINDPRIAGYGLLPDGPAALYSCGLKNHTHDTGCYGEAEKLTCLRKEHTHDETCRSRRLRYADENISVDVTLTNAVYLPANLFLCAELVAEQDQSNCGAMLAAIEDALPDIPYAPEEMLLCRLQMNSCGEPYELPAGVQANVQITFKEPVLTEKASLDGAQCHAFMLIEEETEAGSCKATAMRTAQYKNTDEGITGISFVTNGISDVSVVVNVPESVAPECDILPE